MLKLVGKAPGNRRSVVQQTRVNNSLSPDRMEEGNFVDEFKVHRAIHADHPSLPGHFPDAPIVPGVVILDEMLAALLESRKNCQLTSIRTVKFLVPLKPEQLFTIYFSASHDRASEVNFCCRIEDRIIVEGRLEVCWGDKVNS